MASIALLEVGHFSPAFIVADRCVKSTAVRLIGAENTDAGTVCLKFIGAPADLREVADVGKRVAETMGTSAVVAIDLSADPQTYSLVDSAPVYSPLMSAFDAWVPDLKREKVPMDALGLLETQGLVVNLHATDAMLKASNVSVVGKEKIGGGYVTILVRGDLAAVQAAIDAGKRTVDAMGGKLILADVISNPHPELTALLPKL
ncbi:MAG: BMC domain-containing protein [Planctomycetota bacterium]